MRDRRLLTGLVGIIILAFGLSFVMGATTVTSSGSSFSSSSSSFIDRNNQLNFRKDIYGRDEGLAEMLVL